jgi:hypothetical protein
MKALILRGVEAVLSHHPRSAKHRVKLPIVHARRPGSMDLDNEKIYKIIPFP